MTAAPTDARRVHLAVAMAATLSAAIAGCHRTKPPVKSRTTRPPKPPPIATKPDEDELAKAVAAAGGDVEKGLLALAGDKRDDLIARDSQGNISYVNLSERKITAEGLEHLGKLKASLRRLNLRWTYVTDEALALVAGFENLRKLELAQTPVTDAGMTHLAKLTSLRELDLKGTHVGDAGLGRLAALKQLRTLNLTWTRITDSGLSHVNDLAKLDTLLIENTAITDTGLDRLRTLKMLRHLYLTETRVTAAGVSAFQQAAPRVDVRGP
ncbi:MAG: leucine-rich repeat domain-containing protein [Planctomycetaceae bacterium]